MMKKIGITGQAGFIGTHLFNTLGLHPSRYERIPFQRSFFDNEALLDEFVSSCDVIVHLAGMNRHTDAQVIYDTNMLLALRLEASLKRTNSKAHLIFASSSQEESDNLYGRSKKEARNLFDSWAASAPGAAFTGMIITNVFGPFCAPDYNSVIATFCHQLTHGERPVVQIDRELRLIYVGELVSEILKVISERISVSPYQVACTHTAKVTDILGMLENYALDYQQNGTIPALKNAFELNLFNTFRSYIDIKARYPVHFAQYKDLRGSFSEIIRINVGGQVSFSTTLPGSTRGNHFHTRKIERFAVIKGKAIIQLRKVGSQEVLNFKLSGDEPSYVDMPIWYIHNISNTGSEDLYTIFWINEFYDSEDPDTYFETV